MNLRNLIFFGKYIGLLLNFLLKKLLRWPECKYFLLGCIILKQHFKPPDDRPFPSEFFSFNSSKEDQTEAGTKGPQR